MIPSRSTSTHLYGAAVLLLLVFAGYSAMPNSGTADGRDSEGGDPNVPPPASTETAVTFMRAGLDAKALTAAGVSSGNVGTFAAAALALIDDVALRQADLDYGSARSSYETLVRKVRSGLASGLEVTQCQDLHADCDAALATRDGLLQAYFDAAAATLDDATRIKLQAIRDNSSWQLPEEFLVVSRDERAWLDLRDALATERIAQEYGEDFPDAVQSYLAAERADPAVAAAIGSLAANYAAVQTAWNAAVSD